MSFGAKRLEKEFVMGNLTRLVLIKKKVLALREKISQKPFNMFLRQNCSATRMRLVKRMRRILFLLHRVIFKI